MNDDWKSIGNLRINDDVQGGFTHLALRNVGDADVVIINEDDLVAFRNYLNSLIQERGIE